VEGGCEKFVISSSSYQMNDRQLFALAKQSMQASPTHKRESKGAKKSKQKKSLVPKNPIEHEQRKRVIR
jgi:hypothetical protein